MERATFSAGSFERVEGTSRRLEDVQQTMVRYTGGCNVSTGTTGHAEVAEIYFDSGQVSYEQLLNVFWDAHDPASFNRQRSDEGSQYRSAIFFHSLEQEAAAHASKERLRQSGRFTRRIVTEIVPATRFYRPEKYHERHIERQGDAVSRG